MNQLEQERRRTLAYWGFDSDKRVIDMTLGDLYSLIKFAINRKDLL